MSVSYPGLIADTSTWRSFFGYPRGTQRRSAQPWLLYVTHVRSVWHDVAQGTAPKTSTLPRDHGPWRHVPRARSTVTPYLRRCGTATALGAGLASRHGRLTCCASAPSGFYVWSGRRLRCALPLPPQRLQAARGALLLYRGRAWLRAELRRPRQLCGLQQPTLCL